MLAGYRQSAQVQHELPRVTLALSVPTPEQNASNSEKQTRKLDLEIRKLEQETSFAAFVRSWVPALGLLAGGFAVFTYFNDRRYDTDVRLQEQYAANLKTVAEYVRGENRTTAGLFAALANLNEIVKLARSPTRYRKQVTDVIVTETMKDVDFEYPPQVRFDALCFNEWPDYKDWLSRNPDDHGFLLYRYRQALRVLGDRYPDYFRTMTLRQDGTLVVQSFISERDYLHFVELLNGYRDHLELLAPQGKVESTATVGDAIRNQELATQLLSGGTTSAKPPHLERV